MPSLRILTVTTLYPNAAMPNHAVFVENRLLRIVRAGVEARVVAPVPWFPFEGRAFGRYGKLAAVPREEVRSAVTITHPRFLVVPKVGLQWQPAGYLRAIRKETRRIAASGFDFDLIDAHYLYPDGVAAARLGTELGKPVVISARGTDLNLIAGMPGPQRAILESLQSAEKLIVVSAALGERARTLGVPGAKIAVLRNGVDTDVFRRADGSAIRAKAGASGPVLLAVGNLVPLKGHDLMIRALRDLPGASLLIAGDGPARAPLEALAFSLGLGSRVHFLGSVPHKDLPAVYSAADLLILASEREGWPNVLLEAMACGTPVVAARVGGVPEIVTAPEAGLMIEERTPAAIAEGVQRLLRIRAGAEKVRAHAQTFSWDDTIARQVALYRGIVEARKAAQ